MSEQGVTRFGQDSPALIATSTNVMTSESTEIMPAEPVYAPILGFPSHPASSIVSGSNPSGTPDDELTIYPERLDISCYQGDDVQIPLTLTGPDMSDESQWVWRAQIRLGHAYYAPLINEFAVASDYAAPEPPETEGVTTVTLYLPRTKNLYAGEFHWDLMSSSPFAGPEFPQPPTWTEDPWPPDEMVKTWRYGILTVVRRVTETDTLPPAEIPPVDGGGAVPTLSTYFSGPNGRVP